MNPENLTVSDIVSALAWTEKRLNKAIARLDKIPNNDRTSAETSRLCGLINQLEWDLLAWQEALDSRIPKTAGYLKWLAEKVECDARKAAGVA